MWFDEAGEVYEMFRNSFPLSFLFFVPIFIIISPVSPVGAAHDFAVYRMQHYDLQGSSYGCRNAIVNLEARPMDSKVLTRRCVVAKLREVTIDKFKDMVLQSAGGLIIMLPTNMSELSAKDREHLLDLEQELLQEDTNIPVYISQETPELLDIYRDIKTSINSDQAGSATEALLSSASANGFQMVLNGAQAKPQKDFQVINIQGKLAGHGIEEQLPTIAVVAHYDAFGIAPSLAFGADSNGSGVVALLELARLLSKLYTNSRMHAKFNILFLLSGAGKFNYQGTKRWIEDNLDSTESTLVSDVSYVLCLDTVGNGDDLYMHVSKPPKEGTEAHILMQNLEAVIKQFNPEVKFDLVHKKINLANDMLAWEHERFSIRRLPAFTISHLDSHKSPSRRSITDTRDMVDVHKLTRNTKILAEALARGIFGLTDQGQFEIFNEGMDVQEESIRAWIDYMTSQPRGTQLLHKDHSVISTLEQAMSRHLKDVRRSAVQAEKRDPEFVFFNGAKYTMAAYNVKPAIFDLFLAVGILTYLAAVYMLVQHFPMLYTMVSKLVGPMKSKQV